MTERPDDTPMGDDLDQAPLDETEKDLAIPMAQPPGIRQGEADTGEAPGENLGGGMRTDPAVSGMAGGGDPENTPGSAMDEPIPVNPPSKESEAEAESRVSPPGGRRSATT